MNSLRRLLRNVPVLMLLVAAPVFAADAPAPTAPFAASPGGAPALPPRVTPQQVEEKLAEKPADSASKKPGADSPKETLGQMKGIRVSLIGEVRLPGWYNVSSLHTALQVLATAGVPIVVF